MTEQNLYDTLEVTKDCDQDTIRNHYKRLAQKHHPDKGGDTETFQAIKHSYEVLSDPEKRKRYDATGEHSNGPQQDPVQQIVLQAFMKAIEKILAPKAGNTFTSMMQPNDFEGDVIGEVTKQVNKRIDELRKGKAAIGLILDEIHKIQGKVKRDDDKPNLFESLLQQKAEMGKANIESLEAELAANESALEEINHYRDTGASKRITQAFEQTAQHIGGQSGANYRGV